jgi:ribose/xylose/arabinose/galactoside ABC-type transport system permease subunit
MNLRTYTRRENGPIFLALLATIAVVILVELIFVRGFDISKVSFIKPRNMANVLMQVSTTGILAISMTLVMVSGGIDLSIGQMMCFIGTGMAFMMRIVGLNDWLVASLGVVVAVLFQVLMGFIISRTKLEPFIVSLGFMTIYKGL